MVIIVFKIKKVLANFITKIPTQIQRMKIQIQTQTQTQKMKLHFVDMAKNVKNTKKELADIIIVTHTQIQKKKFQKMNKQFVNLVINANLKDQVNVNQSTLNQDKIIINT